MAVGNEVTMRLLIDSVNEDPKMQEIMGGTTNVYRDKIPTPIKYPFLWLAESKESNEIRHSESVKRGPKDIAACPSTKNEMMRVTAVAVGTGGDTPWKIMERLRAMLIDDETKPNPLKASGLGDDIYPVNALTETRQNLLPTPFPDPDGKDLVQSTQTFLLSTIKKGAC